MSASQAQITVVIVDDHAIVRDGIRLILNSAPDMRVIGEASDGEGVKEIVNELHPTILLLDLKMPGPSPAEIEKWVRTHCPETTTLVLTAHDRDAYLAAMIDAGVVGYLSKNEKTETLLSAIRRAANGEILYTQKQLSRACHWREETGRLWESLTAREHEILRLLAEGLDNAAIAKKLFISKKTVAFHITNILKKLEVDSRLEAAAWLHRNLPDNLD